MGNWSELVVSWSIYGAEIVVSAVTQHFSPHGSDTSGDENRASRTRGLSDSQVAEKSRIRRLPFSRDLFTGRSQNADPGGRS
jgi:hypothetical protein